MCEGPDLYQKVPTNQLQATVSDDGTFCLWDAADDQCRPLLKVRFTSCALTALCWDPGGEVLALAFKNAVRTFNFESKAISEPLPGFAPGSCERNEVGVGYQSPPRPSSRVGLSLYWRMVWHNGVAYVCPRPLPLDVYL